MTIDNQGEPDDQEDSVTWSAKQPESNTNTRSGMDRRTGQDRRQVSYRAITVPNMRSGVDRRSGEDRRKVRLVITGRAMDA